MIYFSETFLRYLIEGALLLTAGAAMVLLLMVVVDFIRGKVW